MRTVRRILVAIKDPSSKSSPAVAKAAQLARAFGAQLELFHSISTPVYLDFELPAEGGLPGVEHTRRVQYISRLESLAVGPRKHGITVTTAADWDYPPHEAIVRRASKIKADLIVAECHAGKRLAPWLLHLTDWELLRYSPVPVLLVKNKHPYSHPVVLAAVDPAHAFAKPAKLDDEILRLGVQVKDALRGTLHVVNAYVPIPVGATPSELLNADATERLAIKAAANARAPLEKVLRKVSIPRSRQHLVGVHPINAIPNVAREIGSALVVMGAVSRSGLKRVFIGNTAERVLDDLSCDVLVVKPPQFINRVARTQRGVRLVAGRMPLPY